MESQFPDVTDAQPPETDSFLVDSAALPPLPLSSEPSPARTVEPVRLHHLMAALRRQPRSRAVSDLFEALCEVLDPDRCARDCPEYESHSVHIARWHDGPEDEPYVLASMCNHGVAKPFHRVSRTIQLPVDVPPAAVPHLETAEAWAKRHAEIVTAYRARRKDRTRTRTTPR